MSRTRGHRNCARNKCWCCNRMELNKFKKKRACGPSKPQQETQEDGDKKR